MARREINRMTARQALTIAEDGRHADGGGLYLVVRERDGSRRWVFLYRERGTSRFREMGLGPAAGPRKAGLALADARRKADDARRSLLMGTDPLTAKRAAVATKNFGEFADELIEAIAPGFKNPKHLDQWKMTLRDYASPLRPKRLDAITTEDVLQVLTPIWASKQETASRLRGRIERVLDAAKAKGHRTGENPARWRGHLSELLPRRTTLKKHREALPYIEGPTFMVDLRQRQSISAKALEFTILTAARSGETLGAMWREIDFAARLWVVPPERMKATKEHRVPLCDRARAILESLHLTNARPTDFIFPGLAEGAPLSNMAMLECLRDLRGKGLTVHGFRSTFRDWAGDTTQFPREIIEAALAHTISNKAEAAYRRGTALERRRQLMAAWQSYLEKQSAQVVALVR